MQSGHAFEQNQLGIASMLVVGPEHQHFAPAYYNLGILYLEGKGVRQDNDEGFRWF